ncbi:uncharacterized protein TNCV_4976741 [Trichonephila clavipes]|nr:uncharacterized protein TNCV_4976741 [Trichonephila clavipes]
MPFTRRPGSGRPKQTSHREYHHIVRNARVQLTASLAAIHSQVERSLGALVSPRRVSYEGAWLKDIWDRNAHYVYSH